MCSLQQRLFSCAERALSAAGVPIHGHPAINDGDLTDRYITKGGKTYKLQFKFTSNKAFSPPCSTGTTSKRTKSNAPKKLPYKQGINDFYIFSVGAVTSTMLCLPESVLIKEGVIETDTQMGKTRLTMHRPSTTFQYHSKHVATVTSFLRSL